MIEGNGEDDAIELVLPRESTRVFKEARERALKSGRDVVYAKGGVLYRISGQGVREAVVGHVEPPRRVERGWKTVLK